MAYSYELIKKIEMIINDKRTSIFLEKGVPSEGKDDSKIVVEIHGDVLYIIRDDNPFFSYIWEYCLGGLNGLNNLKIIMPIFISFSRWCNKNLESKETF